MLRPRGSETARSGEAIEVEIFDNLRTVSMLRVKAIVVKFD